MSDLTTFFGGMTAALPWAAIVALLGVMWKQRVPMRKMQNEADQSLRTDLLRQLTDQEKAHNLELANYEGRILRLEERIENQRFTYESKLEYERVTHAGEMAIFRHRVNNLDTSLNFLLALIETNPDKAQEAAKRTRELREKQELAEQAEKAAISSAKITASSPTRFDKKD